MTTVKTYRALRHIKVDGYDRNPGDYIPEAGDWDFRIRAANMRVGNLEDTFIDEAVLQDALTVQRASDVVQEDEAHDNEVESPGTDESTLEQVELETPDGEEEDETLAPEEETDPSRPALKLKKKGKKNA